MSENTIHAPGKSCSCGKDVVITQIEVIERATGNLLRGCFSEFGELQGSKRERVLRPAFGFKRWIEKCAECFYQNTDQEEMFE